MPSIWPSLSPIGSTIRLLGPLAQLAGGPLLVGKPLRRVLAREGLADLLEGVGQDHLDVAAQLLTVAAHEVDAFDGRGKLEAMLLGACLQALLKARDLALMTLYQRAQLHLAHGRGARELGLARDQGGSVAAHDQPDANCAEHYAEEQEDKTHRHHRVLIRERLTVAPRPDAMHAVRHGFIPWVARNRARLTYRRAGTAAGGRSPRGLAAGFCSRLHVSCGLPVEARVRARSAARTPAAAHRARRSCPG